MVNRQERTRYTPAPGQSRFVAALWDAPAVTGLLAVLGGTAALSALVATLLSPRLVCRIWLLVMACLLIGYAFLGRGFAYLGMPPLFVGEMALGLAVFAFFAASGPQWLLRTPLTWPIIVFMLVGIAGTSPHIGYHGIDALRDAVVWGYAFFALAIGAVVTRLVAQDRVVEWWLRWYPFFAGWAFFAALIFIFAADRLPRWPWGPGIRVMEFKPGDFAVLLVPGLLFYLSGANNHWSLSRYVPSWMTVSSILGALLIIFSLGRAAMVAVAVSLFVGLILQPSRAGVRLAATALFLFVIVTSLAAVELDVGRERAISVRQIVANISSIFLPDYQEGLSGSKEWRLQWWDDIIGYTLHGPYFWTGKGYGINLADDDGYQVSADGSLRSPHNSHLTLLARGGVPAIAMWILLNAAFAGQLVLRFTQERDPRKKQTLLVVLGTWAAFHVNAAFDVYLEGPQGGIWFWCLVGFGMALLQRPQPGCALPMRRLHTRNVAREAC